MPANTEDNFESSYQRLLLFLGKQGQGYVFAVAEDQRMIIRINKDLTANLATKGVVTKTVYLQPESDSPLMYQVEQAAEGAEALIIANIYSIVDRSQNGLTRLTELNFGRERFWELNIPVLLWADDTSLSIIANYAPDLFSQRRHSTVQFTGRADTAIADKLTKDGWEAFRSSEEFDAIKTNIGILERRLNDARSAGYSVRRTLNEIALPLAKNYAELGLTEEANKLLEEFANAIAHLEDEGALAELAQVYYALHRYYEAIQTLRKANKKIETSLAANGGDELPEQWFNNLVYITDWLKETGRSAEIMDELVLAAKKLENTQGVYWKERKLSAIYDRLGNNMIERGNLQEARNYYEQGLKIREQLSKNNPGSEQLQRNLGVSYSKLGNISNATGNMQEARNYYEQGLKIRQQLSKNNPRSEQLQRDLGVSYSKLGDISNDTGNMQDARNYHEQCLKIRERLSKNNPTSEQLQRDLGISYNKLGDILNAIGNMQDARNYHEQCLKIRERLSKNNPTSEQLQRDLGISYNKLGDISNAIGNMQDARNYYEQCLKIAEQLSNNNPGSEQLQRDLSVSYEKLGDISSATGNMQDARNYYDQRLKIAERLSKNNPASEQLQRDLSVSYDKLGGIAQKENKNDAALAWHEKSLSITQKLMAANPLSQQLKNDLAWVQARIDELKA